MGGPNRGVRLVMGAVAGAVLSGTVLVGVGVAAPGGGLPAPSLQPPAGPGVPAAPADPTGVGPAGVDPSGADPSGADPSGAGPGVAPPEAPAVPALPAPPIAPGMDPENTGPKLPTLPGLPANPLDPVNGTPQTADAERQYDQVGAEDGASRQAAPEQSGTVDGATRIPGTPCSGDVMACVDLTALKAWLIVDGQVRRGPVDVRVGDELGPTPVGRFRVEYKDIDHVSSEFGTPMHYAVFFAQGGIAFHEGRQDTDSAGCVKLGHDDAQAWYYALDVGDGVQIVRTSR